MESQLTSPKKEECETISGGEKLSSPTSVFTLPEEEDEWIDFQESFGAILLLSDYSFLESPGHPTKNTSPPNQCMQGHDTTNNIEFPDFSLHTSQVVNVDQQAKRCFPLYKQSAMKIISPHFDFLFLEESPGHPTKNTSPPNQCMQGHDTTNNIEFPDFSVNTSQVVNVDQQAKRRFPLYKQSAMKIISPDLKRQGKFRCTKKIPKMMKGASKLNFDEHHKYDTSEVIDPEAAPSKKVTKSSLMTKMNIEGDQDVWVEKIFCSRHDSKKEIRVFVSKKTGKKIRDEPPTGASRVIYLK